MVVVALVLRVQNRGVLEGCFTVASEERTRILVVLAVVSVGRGEGKKGKEKATKQETEGGRRKDGLQECQGKNGSKVK